MRLKNAPRYRARVGKERVVVADETHVVAARASQGAFPILGHAHRFVGLEKANALVVELGHDGSGSRIVTAFVYDHLEIAVGLREHCLQSVAQSIRPRSGGNDDREHHDDFLATSLATAHRPAVMIAPRW